MPSWPTQSDYKDALQNPDTAFRDPELKASQAERSPMGVPRARSGAFASVYKMTRGPKAVALKLFNFPNEDRAARYQAVSDYLKKLAAKKPAAMVGFEYHPEGIRIGKGWYPTLTMEWVKGKSLGEWVREAMEQRKPDVAAVRKMADSWIQLVLEIQAAKIAHGDLQHDNVMVVGNVPVLVDYDGMCVPSLADPKKPPLDQLEFGKPAYQHPARPAEKLSPHLDHFAAWVILIALRATAAEPTLYTKYVTKLENENLLFTPPDMVTPAGSKLWPDLMKCSDPDVREWSKMLRESLEKPFDQIPEFGFKPKDPYAKLRDLLNATPRDWNAIPNEKNKLLKDVTSIPADLLAEIPRRLRSLCNAARKDYPAIAAESDGLIRGKEQVPDDLKPAASEAVKRVNCRDAVQRALAAGDARAVKTVFQKPLLDGWADKRLIADAENAVNQVAILDRLKAAVATPGDGKALVKMWADDGFKVAGLPEADAYQSEAAKWSVKINAAAEFIRLYSSRATEAALADAWEKVVEVGAHPDIKPEHRKRGEEAERRAPVLAKLAAIPPAASYKNDTALLTAWGDGSALAGCREADGYLSRVNMARDRVSKVAAIQRAIEGADSGFNSENAVVEAAKPLAGYDHPFVDRVKLGAKSVELLAALKAAVDEPDPSDRAIAAAVDVLRATNVELLARLDKVDKNLAAEATAAGRRRKILNEFAEFDTKYDQPDKQDRKWLSAWLKHKDMIHGRRDTKAELRDRLTLAKERTEACAAILAALDGREMFKLRELYEKHGAKLQKYLPLLERKAELDELLSKAERVFGVQKKLEAIDTTLTEEDLKFLRENHNAFRPADKEAIVSRVTNKLKTDAKLMPGRPPVRVVPSGRAVAITALWAWPGHGMVSHCLVAVDKTKHLENPTQADQYGLLKCQLRDHTGEGGGKRVAPPIGASKVYITVWAVVELGWTTVYGPPLHLGPVAVGGW